MESSIFASKPTRNGQVHNKHIPGGPHWRFTRHRHHDQQIAERAEKYQYSIHDDQCSVVGIFEVAIALQALNQFDARLVFVAQQIGRVVAHRQVNQFQLFVVGLHFSEKPLDGFYSTESWIV